MAHLRSRSSEETNACLAILTSGSHPEDWKKSLTEKNYILGARARAKEYGYSTTLFWMNEPGMTPDRISNIIWNRGIEGVIISPLQGNISKYLTRALELKFDLFSSVEIGETIKRPELDRAIHDQYTSMTTLMNELGELNYKRVGLVLEESLDLRVNGKWTGAFLQFQRSLKTKGLPPPLILENPDQKTFDRWFDRYEPDGVISIVRLGLEFIQNRGLNIPKDVGYASLDTDADEKAFPEVSGINQNSAQVGAASVDMLIASIQRGQRGVPEFPKRTQIEGSWKSGKSTCPQK